MYRRTNMENIKSKLSEFLNDPWDPKANYELGMVYYENKQYAGAFTHFQRCADTSPSNIEQAECLLLCSRILAIQGERDQKEYDLILHALSVAPECPEVHVIKARYHSWRKQWTECLVTCVMGPSPDTKRTMKFDFGSPEELAFHKKQAYIARDKVHQKFHPPITNNFNHSQIFQDMFVLHSLNMKKNGFYLEIGAGDYEYGNNTLLLERDYNWSGLALDINKTFVLNYNKNRKNPCHLMDARDFDYKSNLPEIVDYLQLDCDPPNITYEILEKLPFDSVKFRVITYEHDYYNDETQSFREKSRKFLNERGYKMVAGNITPDRGHQCPFEDWWVHPDLVDKMVVRESDTPLCGERYISLVISDC